MICDYLIVGQGLAGSVLARTLLQEGQTVHVVDAFEPASSSRVAGGIIDPIPNRKFRPGWKMPELIAAAGQTYRELENLLNIRFFFALPMIKVFFDEKQRQHWQRHESCATNPYVRGLLEPRDLPECLIAPFGGLAVESAGYMKIGVMVDAFRSWLKTRGLLTEDRFDHAELTIESERIGWRNISARRIIFCEGRHVRHNPLFPALPHSFTKGEVLTICAKNLELDRIIYRDIFILPLGDGFFRVGATFNRQTLDTAVTPQGRHELTDKLKTLLEVDYEVVDQQAGVRPKLGQQKIVYGPHPDHPNVFIFNGLGARGAVAAPYFARQLADFLIGRTAVLLSTD